jgi:hypothetical protein
MSSSLPGSAFSARQPAPFAAGVLHTKCSAAVSGTVEQTHRAARSLRLSQSRAVNSSARTVRFHRCRIDRSWTS